MIFSGASISTEPGIYMESEYIKSLYIEREYKEKRMKNNVKPKLPGTLLVP